jgi:hypothetical protein
MPATFHPLLGLTLLSALPRDHWPARFGTANLALCVLCGGGQVGRQIAATVPVPGGSVMEVEPTDVAISLLNVVLASCLTGRRPEPLPN